MSQVKSSDKNSTDDNSLEIEPIYNSTMEKNSSIAASSWLLISNKPLDLKLLNDKVQVSAGENGASVIFTGNVRIATEAEGIVGITLEHYPEMTESLLQDIIKRAINRWQLTRAVVAHRIGYLTAGQPIVFVGTSALHRKAAFESAEYIMDYLKNEATFWKKEHFEVQGDDAKQKEIWVAPKLSDAETLKRWK